MKCILEQQSSIVIFASPLVSLMMDQKAKFVPMGIVTELRTNQTPVQLIKC